MCMDDVYYNINNNNNYCYCVCVVSMYIACLRNEDKYILTQKTTKTTT